MEVTTLTYRLYKFLLKKSWSYNGKNDIKYIYLVPPAKYGFPRDYELGLPIKNKYKDFHFYMNGVFTMLMEIYPENKQLLKMVEYNENLKHRYEKEWILPEHNSRVDKMGLFDIYLPK